MTPPPSPPPPPQKKKKKEKSEKSSMFKMCGHIILNRHSLIRAFALHWNIFIHVESNNSIWRQQMPITKTHLYNFDSLKPHFYIEKLGLEGYTLFILYLLKNILGDSLEPPRRGGSNEYPQSMFWAEMWKISEFFIGKFPFFGCKVFSIFE